MKKLNDGSTHTTDEIKEIGLQEAAKQFSEGDNTLEKLLLMLWDMGISTQACCRGSSSPDHPAGIIKSPYIAINITPETKDLVFNIVRYVNAKKVSNAPEITYTNGKISKRIQGKPDAYLNIIRFGRDFLRNKNAHQMFEVIIEAILDMKAEKELTPTKADKTIALMEKLSNKTYSSNIYGVTYLEVAYNKTSRCNYEGGGMKPLTEERKKEILKLSDELMEDIQPSLEV